ncbi:hypothetical protein DL769_008549 [Monosporascus sp. CRB-8-3]|nr:hypothetical protein DL769_008549 [Monosporascus sp. CRB-8-3]
MTVQDNPNLVLPKGSLILVTGATGYIAGNVIFEALEVGYRVRGSSRSAAKANTSDIFKSANYETVVVPRMDVEGAFDEAVKDVDAIIHVATPTSRSSDPKEVVGPAVQGIVSILNSALKEPRVKRFVYTSSSLAAALAKPNEKFKIDKNTWNTEVDAYVTQKGTPYLVYSASKMKSELALWGFVKEHQPAFVVNSVGLPGLLPRVLYHLTKRLKVVPCFNIGRVVVKGSWPSRVIIDMYEGKTDLWAAALPQHMINVIDDARLHLIAAMDGAVANERIIAMAYPYNRNDILDVFRELRPGRRFPENDPELGRDLSEVDNTLGVKLLKKWYGQESYTGLKESIRQNLEGVA